MVRILIIEDKQNHLADAKEAVLLYPEISADYAENLEQAMNLLGQKKYDGIISDIFFPSSNPEAKKTCWSILSKVSRFIYESGSWIRIESELAPLGVVVAEFAKEKGIKFVFCTDTYHHGIATQSVFDYACHYHIKMVDIPHGWGSEDGNDWSDKNCRNKEFGKKMWALATDHIVAKE